MINDEYNRGLRFGPLVNSITSNFLEVTITPSEGLAGDFDENGQVDGHDFLLWQRNHSVGSLADWKAHFGEAQLSPVASVVPEPGAILLAISACTLMIAGRRRSF
jgi:hypothetical protein